MDQGVLAAIRHLPAHGRSIKERALRSESFRALCADLAEAERALAEWESSLLPIRKARCIEYQQLIESLEAELKETLDRPDGI